MQLLGQCWNLAVGTSQIIGEFQRMRCGIANPVDSLNLVHIPEQGGKIDGLTLMIDGVVCIDILSKQRDLSHALFRQFVDFSNHAVKWPAVLLTPGVRHHAETAILAAAFHDRDVGAWTFDLSGRQTVEFFDFRKRNVNALAVC